MITGKDIYQVLAAIVPLYVAMILAYGSVRWWNIFSRDQCSGINRFVAVFAVPLLSFHFISSSNPYALSYRFLAADSLQKVFILAALFLWHNFARHRPSGSASLDWTITLFSLSTLPNTLVMGIPLLTAMYGPFSGTLMVQIVVVQSVVWYTLMLFLFEYRGAKSLISEQFPPDVAGSIASFRVDSDVVSLSGREPLQADAEMSLDGKLHVVVRRSAAPSLSRSMASSFHKSASMTPRASNLTGVEIYSVHSSQEPTPRCSSFNQNDFIAMFSSMATSPRAGTGVGLVEGEKLGRHKSSGSLSSELLNRQLSMPSVKKNEVGGANKELHMYVWSSSASPGSDGNMVKQMGQGIKKAASGNLGAHTTSPVRKARANGEVEVEDGFTRITTPDPRFPANGTLYSAEKKLPEMDPPMGLVENKHQMPPASVMTRLILIMVWRKLIRNPNTYSSLLGLIWSLVSFRYKIEMPTIVKGSISILSDAGLGMAMFSLGLFMALQPKIISCGKSVALFSMGVRFLTGPAVIAATSIAIGLRGNLLRVAIVQAALPQGIVPFVFATEYNCHANILSTAVIFGMLIALPITILYYVLLGL